MPNLEHLRGKKLLLIISGGIAAYKSLDLIRRLQEANCAVKVILTKSGAEFITPLSVAALSGEKCYTDLFSLTDETEMGHINLSRQNDAILVAPASANILARMAHGLATDLATTCLLASNKPILVAPAMNPEMWQHSATQDNISLLKKRHVHFIGPDKGLMACGEEGFGRLSAVDDILSKLNHFFTPKNLPLTGKRFLVTAGPTHEPIDPVRYIANNSSGKQGYAIATALAQLGAEIELVSGPVQIPPPEHSNIHLTRVKSAKEMFQACQKLLPLDGAICTAAVGDWAPKSFTNQKIKKLAGGIPPALELCENPDILTELSHDPQHRPKLMIGFAAETDDLLENAKIKMAKKGCDWLLANDVSEGTTTFGGDSNKVHFLVRHDQKITVEPLAEMPKTALATFLADKVASFFQE